MKFKDKLQSRQVNETMASLLCPMKNHLDDKTRQAVEITLRVLQETEVEEQIGHKDMNKANIKVGDIVVMEDGFGKVLEVSAYGLYTTELIMSKEVFIEAYKKWIEEQTGDNT